VPNDDEKIGQTVFIYGEPVCVPGYPDNMRLRADMKRAVSAASNRPHIISTNRMSLFFVVVEPMMRRWYSVPGTTSYSLGGTSFRNKSKRIQQSLALLIDRLHHSHTAKF